MEKMTGKLCLLLSIALLFSCKKNDNSEPAPIVSSLSSVVHSTGYTDTYVYNPDGTLKQIDHSANNSGLIGFRKFEYSNNKLTKLTLDASDIIPGIILPFTYNYEYSDGKLTRIVLGPDNNTVQFYYNSKNTLSAIVKMERNLKDSTVILEMHSSQRPSLTNTYMLLPEGLITLSGKYRYTYDNYGNCTLNEYELNGKWEPVYKSTYHNDVPNPENALSLYSNYIPNSSYYRAVNPHMIATSSRYFYHPTPHEAERLTNTVLERDDKNRPIRIACEKTFPNEPAGTSYYPIDTLTITYK